MGVDNNQLYLIERYLADKLSEEEQQEFNKALIHEDFRAELEQQAAYLDHLSASQDESLKKTLRSLDAEAPIIKLKPNFAPVWIRYAAAALLLFSSLALIRYFTNQQDIRYLALIETHNVIYPAEVIERGDAKILDTDYKQAVALYAQKKYPEANKAFKKLISIKNDKTVIYRANCLIAMKDYKAAIRLLKTNLNSYNLRIKENTQWYLAMAYLGNEQINEATDLLIEINKTPAHLFNEKSNQLLKDLNSN